MSDEKVVRVIDKEMREKTMELKSWREKLTIAEKGDSIDITHYDLKQNIAVLEGQLRILKRIRKVVD